MSKLISIVFLMFCFSLTMNFVNTISPFGQRIWDPAGAGYIPTEATLNASIPRIVNPQVEDSSGTGFIQIGLYSFQILLGALGNSFLLGSSLRQIFINVFGIESSSSGLSALILGLNSISLLLYGLTAFTIIRGIDLDA